MWHIVKDLVLEEMRRLWRKMLRRPEPDPFAEHRKPIDSDPEHA
jgi:hypothetical protein